VLSIFQPQAISLKQIQMSPKSQPADAAKPGGAPILQRQESKRHHIILDFPEDEDFAAVLAEESKVRFFFFINVRPRSTVFLPGLGHSLTRSVDRDP